MFNVSKKKKPQKDTKYRLMINKLVPVYPSIKENDYVV